MTIVMLMTNDIHAGQSYPEREVCEKVVQELRDSTGWDWTFQTIEDETGGVWHHIPCLRSGGCRAYLA